MQFSEVWPALLSGAKIRLPHWKGYWVWENSTIMMHCADGSVIDIRETDNVAFTFDNVASHCWEIIKD
jgi:hypothetical protein